MSTNRLPGIGSALYQQLQFIRKGRHCYRHDQDHDCSQRDQNKSYPSRPRNTSALQIDDDWIQYHRQQDHDPKKQQHWDEGAKKKPTSKQEHDQDEKPTPVPVSEGTEFVVFLLRCGICHQWNPIRRFGFSGGVINSRMGSKTILNWASSFLLGYPVGDGGITFWIYQRVANLNSGRCPSGPGATCESAFFNYTRRFVYG